MRRARKRSAPPSDEWPARMMDEYKILQDKIDKIGAFSFTVKGWSVTITTAALAAAGATKLPFVLPLALIPLVIVFFLLEYDQWEKSWRFGRRAKEIEEALHSLRTDPTFDLSKFAFPLIASEFVQRPRIIPLKRKAKARWDNSFNEKWLIYWVQIGLIIMVSGWLGWQPAKSEGTSGKIIRQYIVPRRCENPPSTRPAFLDGTSREACQP